MNKFKEEIYLALNPDVKKAVEKGIFKNGQEHYILYGKKENRRPFSSSSREYKVFKLINKKGLGLEIGPSHNPIAPKNMGYNVHILDHATASELRKKYKGHESNGVILENIEEVDFVWHGETYQKLIGKTNYYDWIISSHVIEHIPDLISHFQQCEALLKPNGVLSLVIPDKRYCFDYFSSVSTTGQFLDAFKQKRTHPSFGQTFDHFANSTKCGEQTAWDINHKGAYKLIHTFEQAQDLYNQAQQGKKYIDVHCWRFTPTSFKLLISDLRQLGLINLEIKASFDTTGCEFYMSLVKKKNPNLKLERVNTLQKIKLENG
jgi:predicted SAM-dependent methyltransferase